MSPVHDLFLLSVNSFKTRMKLIVLLVFLCQVSLITTQCVCGCCSVYPCSSQNQYQFNVPSCSSCTNNACMTQFPSTCTGNTNVLTTSCQSSGNNIGSVSTMSTTAASTTAATTSVSVSQPTSKANNLNYEVLFAVILITVIFMAKLS
jgi:hypothetical protein